MQIISEELEKYFYKYLLKIKSIYGKKITKPGFM